MVSQKQVERQLRDIGFGFRFWGKGEIRELSKVLGEDELIKQCVNGHYEGGFALLAATDQRLVLVDQKPMYLTIEVIWYDKIGQIDFNHRLLNASINLFSMGKQLQFTSWNHGDLRRVLLFTQQKMAEAKQNEQQVQGAVTNVYEAPVVAAIEPQQQTQVVPRPQAPASNQPAWIQTYNIDQSQPARMMPQAPEPTAHTQPITMPVMPQSENPVFYAASRLPFSRRRYAKS